MSTCTGQTMTNHHAPSLFADATDTLHLWRDRIRQRHELLEWSERDIRDAGYSVGEVVTEASKPFWRA